MMDDTGIWVRESCPLLLCMHQGPDTRDGHHGQEYRRTTKPVQEARERVLWPLASLRNRMKGSHRVAGALSPCQEKHTPKSRAC